MHNVSEEIFGKTHLLHGLLLGRLIIIIIGVLVRRRLDLSGSAAGRVRSHKNRPSVMSSRNTSAWARLLLGLELDCLLKVLLRLQILGSGGLGSGLLGHL